VRIAVASAADLEDVLSVERDAFGEDDEADLVLNLLNDASARPLLSLLARDGERPVGHILFTAARLDGAPRDVSVAILAPLAVVPEAQRRGIGGSLIEHGVKRLGESGVELVFVLGHPGYYPCHGFEPAGGLGLAAPYPISPEDAWMVRALRSGVIECVRGTIACAEVMNRPEYWRE
jgi:putative acetyltransferase